MRTKISLAALVAATCLTTPVLAADLYTKAPPPVAAPILYADWSGVYVGLEAGYGWGRNSFDPLNSVDGFGGAGNIANILNGNAQYLFPEFTHVGPISSINQQGWMAGGFAGAQKQWGSWVLGVEADFDAADIHGSVQATGVEHDVKVTSFSFGMPSVSGNVITDPYTLTSTGNLVIAGQNITSTGNLTIAGQNITSTGSLTIAGQNITSTGKLTIPGQTINSGGNLTIPAQSIDSTGSLTIPAQSINSTGSLAIAGQTITSTENLVIPGGTFPARSCIFGVCTTIATVTVPAQTVPVTVTGATPAVTLALSVNGTTQTVTLPVTVNGATTAVTLPLSVTGATTAVTLPVTVNGVTTTVTLPLSVTGATKTVTLPVTVNGATQTVTLPLSVTGVIPSQNQPLQNGIVNTPVLQQFQQLANVTRTLSVDTKIDELGSLRGKVGFTPAHDWLLYATGGLAWAHATSTVNATETLDFGEGGVFSHTSHSQGGGTMLGWAVGAGVDWKHQIDQGSAIVLGLQYLHYDFPKNTIALADGGVSANFVNNHQSVDAIKGRVSYLFNIH